MDIDINEDLYADILDNVVSDVYRNYSPVSGITSHEQIHRLFSLGLDWLTRNTSSCVVDNYFQTRPNKSLVVSWSPSLIAIRESLQNPPRLTDRINFKGRIRIPNPLFTILDDCIRNESNIVIIPYSVWVYVLDGEVVSEDHEVFGIPTDRFRLEGHQVLVLINKSFQQVEFYDPNGSEVHYEWFQNEDYERLKEFLISSFPEMEDYEWFEYEDICPSFGIQHFDEQEGISDTFVKGYCKFWTLFNLHIRLLYPDTIPLELQTTVLQIFTERGSRFSRGFIQKYISFINEHIHNM